MYELNFLIGYKQSFVSGKTLNKWTISFRSKARITDLNNKDETCCQLYVSVEGLNVTTVLNVIQS